MANIFLEQKINEIKGTLSKLSASQLNDLMADTRGKFDGQLIAEDHALYLGLFRSIHEEHTRRHPPAPGVMREHLVSDELQAELAGMNNDDLATAVKASQAAVFGTEYVMRNSPEYRNEYSRLTALNIERSRRQEQEREKIAADLEANKQRQIAHEIQAKRAGQGRTALDDSMAEV